MFKSIAFSIVLMSAFKVHSIAPLVAAVAVSEGIKIVSEFQNGLGEALDVLDLSEDLLEEFGESDGTADEFSTSLSTYNRELNLLKNDMHSVGYTDEQISDFTDRMNSGQSSLTQKMRSLKRTIRSIKKMKTSMHRLFNKKGADVAVQRGILSTQQQSLHLQMQQMEMFALRDLEEKREKIASRKATEAELTKTTQEIAQRNLLQFRTRSNPMPEFQLTDLQKYAVMASVGLFVIGCVGILFGLFREQGMGAIRAAIFGLILSYVLPGIVYLYRSWLGV